MVFGAGPLAMVWDLLVVTFIYEIVLRVLLTSRLIFVMYSPAATFMFIVWQFALPAVTLPAGICMKVWVIVSLVESRELKLVRMPTNATEASEHITSVLRNSWWPSPSK